VTRQTLLNTVEVDGELGYVGLTTLPGRLAGVITRMPFPGAVIGRGKQVYRVDDQPIVLMYGAVPSYRSLGPGTTGADVRQLETNLAALGYRGFTVDATYSNATSIAVRRWQKSLGLPQTGRVELGRVLFAPGKIRVQEATAGVSMSTGDGQDVLRYTGTGRQVTVLLDVSRQQLARPGAEVRIQLPDGRGTEGRVNRAFTVIDQPPTSDTPPETRIEAIVWLDNPESARGIEAAAVQVVFTLSERTNVLTVPVAALVALAQGGYGLELVEGPSTRYLQVQTGLFAEGRVEVTGDGLQDGMTIGMPS
jgi:peptidoglycan hydrolase-like protein with peptidoglycan-binding domain